MLAFIFLGECSFCINALFPVYQSGEGGIGGSRNARDFKHSRLLDECAEQTALFFQRAEYDPSYCFELFRRALCEQDQEAWTGLMAQYRALLRSWVERHPVYRESGETHEYFCNRTFEKLWQSVDRKKFQKFRDLSSLLRYVQMCVHSVLVDHARANKIAALQVELEDEIPHPDNPSPEAHALDRVQGHELWEYVEARASGKQEKICIYASFVLGLKPRQMLEHFPNAFKDTDEIYLVKQNVINRLRRDARFAALFKDGD